MSPQYIPQEIIDCIVDELRHETRALMACSLVSRSFFPSSQRLLFASLYFDFSTRSAALSKRLQLALESNPSLTTLIENLSFGLSWNADGAQIRTLPPTLMLMSHLRSFTLYGHTIQPWSEIPKDLRTGFTKILRLPSLVSATISGVHDFPSPLLIQSIQLKRLSTMNFTVSPFDTAELERSDPSLRRGQLEALSGGEGESDATATQILIKTLAQRGSLLDVSHLRHFSAAVWSNEGIHIYQAMINSAAKSLETLTLSVGRSANCQSMNSLNIGSLRNLRRLSVSIFEHANSPRWLLHLIASISERHCTVEEVSINAFFVDFSDVAWGELDAVLTNSKFTCLQSVTLRYWKQHNQKLLPEVQFPRLLTQNIFFVFHESDRVFPRIARRG